MEDEPRKITQVSRMRTEGKDKIMKKLDLNLDDDQPGQGKIPMETLDSISNVSLNTESELAEREEKSIENDDHSSRQIKSRVETLELTSDDHSGQRKSKEDPRHPTTLNSVEEDNKPTERQEKWSHKSKAWRKVQYIGYASTSIIFPMLVMIIWLNNRNDSKGTSEVPKNKTVSTSNACPFWDLTGDGYCDDEANIPECGYDYNDCCQLENDRSFCSNCTCHLSEDEVQLFQDQSKSQSCIDGLHLNQPDPNYELFFPELFVGGPGSNHLGDGICNLNFNIDKYFFDIGDCCLDEEEIKCRLEEDYIECPQNTCIRSNNFCIAEELGDGLCQDYNNGPYCDYDLGDCCTPNSDHLDTMDSKKDCCACFCKTRKKHPYSPLRLEMLTMFETLEKL